MQENTKSCWEPKVGICAVISSTTARYVLPVRMSRTNTVVIREKCMERCGDTKHVKKCLKKRFPISVWLPEYSLRTLECDIIAGLSVGLMVVPQGLAYAKVAGLPPQYGLYSAFMGCFLYCILGTSKDITLGPTAVMSLIVSVYGRSDVPELTVALTLFSGIIQLAMGLLRLDFVVNFISIPIVSGFTSAAAIIIGVNQLKDMLGLTNIPRPFFERIYHTFNHIGETRKYDLLLGLISLIVLLALRKLGRLKWTKESNTADSKWTKVAKKLVLLLSIARNALVIMLAAVVTVILYQHGHEHVFSLTGDQDIGLPPFQAPSLSITKGNVTLGVGQILKELGPGLAIVPLIGFLESIAIAKAFARKNRYKVDASQELVALGIANCLSSFVSSYPVTGSFSRTAVNAQSGVATPAGGIFTGAIVLLALGILTPFFKYIPKASLAALIITSVLTMVDYNILKMIWTVRRIDLLPLVVTFFGCFYEIEIGILCGIGVALLILLYPIVWPPLAKVGRGDHALLKISGNLTYPGIEHIVNEIQEVACAEPPPPAILLDLGTVTNIDYTVVQGLLIMLDDLENRSVPLYFSEVKDSVRDRMVDGGIDPSLINPSADILARAVNPLEIA